MESELGLGADSIEDRFGSLSAEKRQYLERLLQKKTEVGTGPTEIPRRKASDPTPLSFAQQRLWFLEQMTPGNPFYNVDFKVRFASPIDLPALKRSLNEIVRRHETLRTSFQEADGQPVQVIAPSLTLEVPVIDLRELPEVERTTEAARLAKEEAERPFDLAQGPLIRITLLRLGDEEYESLMTMHHIVCDGWSMSVFSLEFNVLYYCFFWVQPSPFPELPIQYADFAVWQRQWLQGEVLETQLAYWKEQLSDLPVLQLPTDRPRPLVQTYQGARQSFEISDPVYLALLALSQQEGVTLFMTLLAAFQTLLFRYTSQEDIVVGVPVANRNRPETQGLIGFFVNTLVMRTDLSDNPTFRELLSRVHKMATGAYAHQDLPFEKLVAELAPERDLSRNPLFQVIFQLFPVWSLAEESASPAVGTGTSTFDLRFDLYQTLRGLSGMLEYSTDLFDAETIKRMVDQWQTLLEGIVANPDQRLSDLPLLLEAEQHQLLVEWNDTQADYPRNSCIHDLFQAQVERTPDAIAVVFDDDQLTYTELNRRANQLAHHLESLGVGPEALVGICVERSVDMVVGLLGILKAGGAYVPLDPAYPKERLAYMLEDTRAPVLLTQQHLVASLPEDRATVVCLDADWDVIAQESQDNPVSRVTGDSLAYVMYTSGSTGRPKGVAVRHRGVLRLLVGSDYIHLDAQETFLHMASISFDASTLELWGPLLHGARCVLFSDQVPSAQDLGDVIQRHGVSTLWLTSSLFNTVIDEAPEVLSALRQLLIGGEALSVAHVRRALELLPSTNIINGYGPTESTTFTCCYSIPRQLGESIGSIPIGRPIANTQVYLLDQFLNPVPMGVPGEICIGGDGLARGYLNQPELTAEKFIPNPFSDEPEARMYRSGDLARYLPDGNIEFLGRLDDQVKIRGFRVELGEVEVALGDHPAVREATALVREDVPGDKRLVAYIVPNQQPAPTSSELRRFLQDHLPEYMIPSIFVTLDALPLTPNGKVDRRALPAPDWTRPELEQTFVAPRTPVEEKLAEIWAEVLGLDQVGIHDNFFELGGHSLLATQAISRIGRAFQVKIPLQAIFKASTVAELGNVIEKAKDNGMELRAPAIPAIPRESHRVKVSSPGVPEVPQDLI